jgi:PAS domain S-box-containing protein
MALQLIAHTNGHTKTDGNYGYRGKPITDIITNGFFSVDRKWTVTYWNKAAERLLGVKAKEIVGTNLWEKFVAVLPIDFYTVYHKAFLQDVPVHFKEYWGEMGAWFDVITYYCDATLFVSFKSSNQPANPDYSKPQEHPADQLKILNELYRYVTEVTNDCLWEWDLQTRELFWIDGGHRRIFGYQIENSLIPQSFWESRLHPADKDRILTRLNKIISEGSASVWEDEYRFKKANGDYAWVHDRGHLVFDDYKKASRMIGATQDISERVLLQKKLDGEIATKQREITKAILTAQEREREDIGKELHDNLNQTLVVAKLYLQMAKSHETNREMNLEKSLEFIEQVIQEIRRISKKLVIPGTHIIGLFDNIKNLLADLGAIHTIKFQFQPDGIAEKDIDDKMQITIFRIVQEQLNNILRHSKATSASIRLSKHENDVILAISDDGKGCDVTEEKTGVGILNIKSRADLYGGTIAITSKPGEGYELKVMLPSSEDKGLNQADQSS